MASLVTSAARLRGALCDLRDRSYPFHHSIFYSNLLGVACTFHYWGEK